ncbi:MAG: ABC transporter substrate-binding protein [Acidobacteria bacterium]|nr:ABC transporter substrate-binding protein [Acidobacteriota bacterium]
MKRTCQAVLFFALLSANATLSATAIPGGSPFRIAFNTWVGYSPLVIAREKGFLREAGIDAKISILEGIGEKNSALIRGDIDGVGHTADSAVTSVASGVDGQIVFVFDRSLGADGILAKKRIRSIADLKGKKVALEPGFTGHFFFLYLLDEAGLKPHDVQVIPMDTGSAGSAFVAGTVEAAVTWEPWIGKTKSLSDAHVLVTSADKPGVIIDVLFMNRSTIDKRRDDVRKLVVAMGRATDWYAQNVKEGDEIIAKFWKLKLEEEKETVAGMRFMPLTENAVFFGTADAPGPLLTVVQKANDLWLAAGVTKVKVQAEKLIDFSTVNAAATKARSVR